VAGALARAGDDVVVVAREETAEAIARDGLRVDSVLLGEFAARPRATARLEEPVDVLVIATKATALADALERIAGEPDLVVPLLNGIDHLALLRERYGARAVAGTIRVEAERVGPGRIAHTSRFLKVELASEDQATRPALVAFAAALTGAGIPASVEDSETQVLWSKLARLNAIACTTSASGRELGFVREDPEWRVALDACIDETAAVARAEGAHIDPAQVRAELDEAHAELKSSMLRDLEAGREPELDAIPGAVIRAGARHGIACPTVARLAGVIAARAGIPAPVPA
jgi:2-dehydropantoate 2-reductase